MAAVGRRAGLARTSVYQYFGSAEELLAAVVARRLPRVGALGSLDRVAAAATPADRVWAYVEANLDLFASSEQAVARALTRVVEPQVLAGPMKEFHAPAAGAAAARRWPSSASPSREAMAEHIDSLIVQASRGIDVAAPDAGEAQACALARLRRLLAPYLELPVPPRS